MKEYADNLSELLLGLMIDDKNSDCDTNDETDEERSEFMGAVVNRGHVAAKPVDNLGPSRWTDKQVKIDASDLVPLSKNHYMGQVVIGGTLINALMDTCGAKSMVDCRTAEVLGFKVERATK